MNNPKKIMGKSWAVVELVQFLHPLLPRTGVSSLPRTQRVKGGFGGLTLITDGFSCALTFLPSLLCL